MACRKSKEGHLRLMSPHNVLYISLPLFLFFFSLSCCIIYKYKKIQTRDSPSAPWQAKVKTIGSTREGRTKGTLNPTQGMTNRTRQYN